MLKRVLCYALLVLCGAGLLMAWIPQRLPCLYDRRGIPDPYAGHREVASATVRMIEANPWKSFGLGTWTNV